MTYKELKVQVSKNAQVPFQIVDKVVEELFQTVRNALLRGERLQIPAFGVFYVKTRKPRKVRTIEGKIKQLPTRRVPVFAPAHALKKEIESNTFKEE
ncbi:integration host factor subunit beta [Persephonella hydrogeniphila]|uniref:Integration host factor subunit beta n=1 Tax=Persephonella hydrogeniphila TaxID=198703 RepID=A0A285NG50_9AQUI|nr:HU family DNA-binding protein [Persephonella hydrogeniphila]SNZ08248.1 integration host factor subunit beta [Persephonella hydrogeniphila]